MYRFLLSLVAAAFITIAIFFLMMSLIKFTYTPVDRSHTLITRLHTPQLENPPDTKKQREKLILMKTLSPPSSSGGNPPSPRNARSSLPPIPRLVVDTSLSEKINFYISLKNAIAIPSPNIGIYQSSRGYAGSNSGYGTGVGLGTDPDNGNICTIGFTLNPNEEIGNLQWYNCMGKEISDLSETRLYAWIRDHPDKVKQLNATSGEEIFVTFNNQ